MGTLEKPWSELTLREINKIKAAKCLRCAYAGRYGMSRGSDNVSQVTCDYILIVKHSRGCRPDACDKFVHRDGKRRRSKAWRLGGKIG